MLFRSGVIVSACILASSLLILSRNPLALGNTAGRAKTFFMGAAFSQILMTPLLMLSVLAPSWNLVRAVFFSVGLAILLSSVIVFDRSSSWAKFASIGMAVLGFVLIAALILVRGET